MKTHCRILEHCLEHMFALLIPFFFNWKEQRNNEQNSAACVFGGEHAAELLQEVASESHKLRQAKL